MLNLFAAIDQTDANWIVILKDVGPDVSVQTARDGERWRPNDLFERELCRGWLKASHRAVDEKRSKPGRPWHPLTREAQKPVKPGEIEEYAIEIMATANLFRKGYRICVEITTLDMPTGVGSATNAEYIPNHIGSSKTVVAKIFHDTKRPSHLLLPVRLRGVIQNPSSVSHRYCDVATRGKGGGGGQARRREETGVSEKGVMCVEGGAEFRERSPVTTGEEIGGAFVLGRRGFKRNAVLSAPLSSPWLRGRCPP